MQSFLSSGVKFHRVFSSWRLFFALLLKVGHFRPIRGGLPEAVDRKTTKRNEKIMPPHECSLAAARPPCQVVFVSTRSVSTRCVAGVGRGWGRGLAGMSDWRMSPDLHDQVRGQNQAPADQQVHGKVLVLIVDTD